MRRRFEKAAKTGNDKEAVKTYSVLSKVKDVLESGKSARAANLDETELEFIEDIHLLTIKPVLYVCNVDEASAKTGNKHVEAVKEAGFEGTIGH